MYKVKWFMFKFHFGANIKNWASCIQYQLAQRKEHNTRQLFHRLSQRGHGSPLKFKSDYKIASKNKIKIYAPLLAQ